MTIFAAAYLDVIFWTLMIPIALNMLRTVIEKRDIWPPNVLNTPKKAHPSLDNQLNLCLQYDSAKMTESKIAMVNRYSPVIRSPTWMTVVRTLLFNADTKCLVARCLTFLKSLTEFRITAAQPTTQLKTLRESFEIIVFLYNVDYSWQLGQATYIWIWYKRTKKQK